MLKLIIGLALIIFSPRQPVADPDFEKDNIQIDKDNKEVDLGVAFDRIATRFGAFVIVAAISYPLVRSTMAVQSARAYALPGIESNSGTFVLMSIFSVLMLLVTVIFGISTFSPFLYWFERKVNAARLVVALLLGIVLFTTVLLYIFVITMVIFSDRLLPELDEVSDMLQHLHVCENNQLRGAICERALSVCHETTGPSACRNAVLKYVDTLRPSIGRVP